MIKKILKLKEVKEIASSFSFTNAMIKSKPFIIFLALGLFLSMFRYLPDLMTLDGVLTEALNAVPKNNYLNGLTMDDILLLGREGNMVNPFYAEIITTYEAKESAIFGFNFTALLIGAVYGGFNCLRIFMNDFNRSFRYIKIKQVLGYFNSEISYAFILLTFIFAIWGVNTYLTLFMATLFLLATIYSVHRTTNNIKEIQKDLDSVNVLTEYIEDEKDRLKISNNKLFTNLFNHIDLMDDLEAKRDEEITEIIEKAISKDEIILDLIEKLDNVKFDNKEEEKIAKYIIEKFEREEIRKKQIEEENKRLQSQNRSSYSEARNILYERLEESMTIENE